METEFPSSLLKEQIQTLQATVAQQAQLIASLETTNTALGTELNRFMDSNKSNDNEIQQQQNKASLQARIAEQERNITSLQKANKALETKINILTTAQMNRTEEGEAKEDNELAKKASIDDNENRKSSTKMPTTRKRKGSSTKSTQKRAPKNALLTTNKDSPIETLTTTKHSGTAASNTATTASAIVTNGDETAKPLSSSGGDTPPKKKKRRNKQKTFEERVENLKAFKAKHGHCNVPYRYDLDPSLGEWVKDMRRGVLKITYERKKLLNQVGFNWETRSNRRNREWNDVLDKLKRYKAQNGDCKVPW